MRYLKLFKNIEFLTESKKQKEIEEYFDFDFEFLEAAKIDLEDLNQEISISEHIKWKCHSNIYDIPVVHDYPTTRNCSPCISIDMNFSFDEEEKNIVEATTVKFLKRLLKKGHHIQVVEWSDTNFDTIEVLNDRIMLGEINLFDEIPDSYDDDDLYEANFSIIIVGEKQNLTWKEYFDMNGIQPTKVVESKDKKVFDLEIKGDKCYLTCRACILAEYLVDGHGEYDEMLTDDDYDYNELFQYWDSYPSWDYEIKEENINRILEILRKKRLLKKFKVSLGIESEDTSKSLKKLESKDIRNVLRKLLPDLANDIADVYRDLGEVNWTNQFIKELDYQFNRVVERQLLTESSIFHVDGIRWVTFKLTDEMTKNLQDFPGGIAEMIDDFLQQYNTLSISLVDVYHSVDINEFNVALSSLLEDYE